MIGPAHEMYVQADMAYRREQLMRTYANRGRRDGYGWAHRVRQALRSRHAQAGRQGQGSGRATRPQPPAAATRVPRQAPRPATDACLSRN
jgi:hypothetical protein